MLKLLVIVWIILAIFGVVALPPVGIIMLVIGIILLVWVFKGSSKGNV